MKILKAINDFVGGVGIELTGGFAIYFILCTGYVTIVACLGLGRMLLEWIK